MAWPTLRLPAVQQALIVALNVNWKDEVDAQELISICSLTRLTSLELHLSGPRAPQLPAASAIASLTNLCWLSLAQYGGDWKHLDWSPLTRLTFLELRGMDGASSAASTVPKLKQLHLSRACDLGHVHLSASHRFSMLTCLELLTVDGRVLLEEVLSLPQLPSLRELVFGEFQDTRLSTSYTFLVGLKATTGLLDI